MKKMNELFYHLLLAMFLGLYLELPATLGNPLIANYSRTYTQKQDWEEELGNTGNARMKTVDPLLQFNYKHEVAFRFQLNDLPANAIEIYEANIRFTARTPDNTLPTVSPALRIYAEKAANSQAQLQVSQTHDITSRQKTTNFVPWENLPDWPKDSKHTLEGLEDVITEVISVPGWNAGNYLTIIVTAIEDLTEPTPTRISKSTDGSNNDKFARLTIKWRDTLAPTKSPVTSEPTYMPTTSTPTTNPTSSAPTMNPTSSAPTTNPTSSSPTVSPTKAPTTPMPTNSPVTPNPTASPNEAKEEEEEEDFLSSMEGIMIILGCGVLLIGATGAFLIFYQRRKPRKLGYREESHLFLTGSVNYTNAPSHHPTSVNITSTNNSSLEEPPPGLGFSSRFNSLRTVNRFFGRSSLTSV